MKIFSLARDGNELRPVEVEITLLPGLPQILFLGLPDQVIKESLFRIKSAIRAQNFEFPRAQQVIVNIRPNYIRKSSKGIELAVAVALLALTHQIKSLKKDRDFFVYGELGLDGQVYEPDDLASDCLIQDSEVCILTGKNSSTKSSISENRPYRQMRVSNLAQLSTPEHIESSNIEIKVIRDEFGLNKRFSSQNAQLLKVVSLDKYSILFAGRSGAGKSTLARAVSSFLEPPNSQDILEVQKNHPQYRGKDFFWWPIVQPHHSATPISLVGGGALATGGELVRAHRGILILDELLEFNEKCQESLREPMEEGCIRLARGIVTREYKTEFIALATTNLCRCGYFLPKNSRLCRCSRGILKKYMDRLSGPLVDRFAILSLQDSSSFSSENAVDGSLILKELNEVRDWRIKEKRSQLNTPNENIEDKIPNLMKSYRRRIFTQKVARTLADLEYSETIRSSHIEEALEYTWHPFERLRNWDI